MFLSLVYAITIFIILGTTYVLVRQIQRIMIIRRLGISYIPNYKRTLIGNYLVCIAIFGFLISYSLEVLVGISIIQSNLITTYKAAISCYIFLCIFLITKFFIIPEGSKQSILLKS